MVLSRSPYRTPFDHPLDEGPPSVTNTAPSTLSQPIAGAKGLALGLAASVLVGAVLAAGLANLLRWNGVDGGLTVEQSIIAGAAAIAFGALIGLSLLWPASSRSAPKFGLMVVASSTSRMMISLAVGVVMLFIAKPAAYPLFAALCTGFILCLIVESVWAMSALRRNQSHGGPTSSTLTTGAIVR
jgi:hypothetical protein